MRRSVTMLGQVGLVVDEGHVALEARAGIVAAQDHPFHQLLGDRIGDVSFQFGGIGLLAVAHHLDGALDGGDVDRRGGDDGVGGRRDRQRLAVAGGGIGAGRAGAAASWPCGRRLQGRGEPAERPWRRRQARGCGLDVAAGGGFRCRRLGGLCAAWFRIWPCRRPWLGLGLALAWSLAGFRLRRAIWTWSGFALASGCACGRLGLVVRLGLRLAAPCPTASCLRTAWRASAAAAGCVATVASGAACAGSRGCEQACDREPGPSAQTDAGRPTAGPRLRGSNRAIFAAIAIALIRLMKRESRRGNAATVGAALKMMAELTLAGRGPFIDRTGGYFLLCCREGRPPGRPSRKSRNAMTAKTRFRGSFTALVTPFKNGAVDEKAFRELVELADRRGHQRPGSGRHHGRKPDARPTRSTSRSWNGASSRPRAGCR